VTTRVLAALAILAGCTAQAAQTPAGPADASLSPAREQAVGQPIAITFQTPFPRESPEFVQLRAVLDAFQERRRGTVIELLPDGPADANVITRRILAGCAADVLEIPLESLPEIVERGLLVPVRDSLNDSAGVLFSSAVAASEAGGTNYAVPLRARTTQLICNADILRRCGYDPNDPLLNNWNEMLVTCEGIRRTLGGQGCYPIAFDAAEGSSLSRVAAMLIKQAQGMLVRKGEADGADTAAWRVGLQDETGTQALSMMSRLAAYIPAESLWWRTEDLLQAFVAGRVAMFFGDASAVNAIRRTAPLLEMRVVEAPVNRASGSSTTVYGAVIPANAAAYEEACKALLTYLCTMEAQKIVMTGGPAGMPNLVPVRRALLEDRWYVDHPEYKPFLQSLRYACSSLPIPGWGEVERQVFVPELRSLLRGEKEPKAATAIIRRRGDEVLATYYNYTGHPSETTLLGMSLAAVGVFFLIFFTVGQRSK